MRKNLFTLLSISLVILGSCTSKQMEEELTSPLSTTEDGVVTGVVSTQKDIELKALYEKAKHFKSELRSFNSPRQENALYRIADNVLNSNIFNLNGSRYQIEGTNPSGKKVRLTTHQSSVWTNYKSGDLFYIEALPSVAGIPYVIYQGSKDNKRPLGAGTLQKNGEKKSVAYIGPNCFSFEYTE